MKRLLSIIIMFALLITMGLFVSCKPSAEATTTEAEDTSAEATTTEAEDTSAEATTTEAEDTSGDESKKIGISMRSVGDSFNLSLLIGARNKINEMGYTPVVTDAKVDPLQQLKDVDNLIIQGVKGVIIQPEEPTAIIPAIEKLNEANIPVYAIDVGPHGGKVEAVINFGQFESGVSSGEIMELLILEVYGDNPEGIILDIMGDVRHTGLTDERSNGFRSVFEKYEGIEVVSQPGDWLVDKAYTVTTDLLTKYGDKVLGIGMASDDMVAGVVSAIDAQGLFKAQGEPGHIFITSIDGGPEGLDFIKEGKVDGIALQPSKEYGELAAHYLIKQIEGEEVVFTEGQLIEEEGAIWSPAMVIMVETGPNLILNSGKIPVEIDVDDPRLWGNDTELREKLE